MILRDYQKDAVASVYNHLRTKDTNPCVVIPTGGGKTPVMATICRDAVTQWNGRVIILAHVKELLTQTVDKLMAVCPDVSVGVYSAGLKRRETGYPITVAGIQSVYKRAEKLGHYDLAIVDEAHLLPPEGEGMYRTFLAGAREVNPELRVIGMTATPFRTKGGMICKPENLLNEICYEVGVKELIVAGFLCKLTSKAGAKLVDLSGVKVRGGEFVAEELEKAMDDVALISSAVEDLLDRTKDRQAVLVFCSGVAHGKHVAETIREATGDSHCVEAIFGNTEYGERDHAIRRFLSGSLKFLVNVNVLTLGFDATNIDCIAMLRPTLSPGLYYQMVGRGLRIHPDKMERGCLVLDFGGNVMRHGLIDKIKAPGQGREGEGDGEAPVKTCPECRSIISLGYTTCPDCGFDFPEPEVKHGRRSYDGEIISGDPILDEYEVQEIFVAVHEKKGAPHDHPKTFRVDYKCGLREQFSEWVCFEHHGFPRKKAVAWWKARSNSDVPGSSECAKILAEQGALANALCITVQTVPGEKYPRVVDHVLEEKPTWPPEGSTYTKEQLERFEDVPF